MKVQGGEILDVHLTSTEMLHLKLKTQAPRTEEDVAQRKVSHTASFKTPNSACFKTLTYFC